MISRGSLTDGEKLLCVHIKHPVIACTGFVVDSACVRLVRFHTATVFWLFDVRARRIAISDKGIFVFEGVAKEEFPANSWKRDSLRNSIVVVGLFAFGTLQMNVRNIGQ